MKYKLANGWTKEKVMEQVKKYNNGTRCQNQYTKECFYSKDGNRCAVGCFIPDDHIAALEFRGGSLDLLLEYPELNKFMPFDDPRALSHFQGAHDTGYVDNIHRGIEKFLGEWVE